MLFLRKWPGGPYALPVAMAAVKAGENVLLVGSGNPKMLATIAARSGLTGRVAALVTSEPDRDRIRAAGVGAGLLLEVAVVPAWAGFSDPDGKFDVAVVDSSRGWLGATSAADRMACLGCVYGALRHGGRALVIERRRSIPMAWIRPAKPPVPDYVPGGGAKSALEGAGFHPVRVLAERRGWRFTEGLRSGETPRVTVR